MLKAVELLVKHAIRVIRVIRGHGLFGLHGLRTNIARMYRSEKWFGRRDVGSGSYTAHG